MIGLNKRALLQGAVIVACASGCATSAKFAEKLDGLVGASESAVVARYGPPRSSYTLTDGSRVIQYSRGGRAVIPGATTIEPVSTQTSGSFSVSQGAKLPAHGTYNQTSTTYVQKQAPSTVIALSCTFNFMIGADGKVRSWSFEGNNCVSE